MNKTLNQHQALHLLKEGDSIEGYEVKFNNEKVEALDAVLLGKNNVQVPEELIYYDEQAIDFSDDPDITDNDLEQGKISWQVKPPASSKTQNNSVTKRRYSDE